MCAMEFRNVRDRPPDQPAGVSAAVAPADSAGGDAAQLARPPIQPDRQKWVERLERMENRSGVRDQLRDRMNQLKEGHPSSPWHEDGTPREPVPRLSDFEQPLPTLTDADYQAHVEELERGLDAAAKAGLSNAELHTLNGDRVTWTPERNKIHARIVADEYAKAAEVPCDRQAIIAGGLGGSGKTTVLGEHAGIDRSKFLTINPDDFKETLAKEGLIADIPGLTPMETTTLAHDESSVIARRLAVLAMADGKNIIWDITLSSKESGSGRAQELRTAGYEHIKGIFVDIPIDTSLARSEARHRRGHEQFLDGHGFGGRYVPPEVIKRQADKDYGTANRRTFEELKSSLDDWVIYDNSVDGRPPVLIDRKDADRDS
ncbi:MAG TPA: zeta toxin family protein [Streptosporangiaceae bacterium]|nr:zeta toxin family protein [Streptosporangiaceae bacterium]